MTAEPIGELAWSPDPMKQRLASCTLENVSPGTRRRDRFEKPVLHASAGVPHYRRTEQNPVHIFAHDLVEGRYELMADAATELVLSKPFEIKPPIRDIAP